MPGHSAISGPAELPAAAAGGGVPGLVLEAVSRSVGLVYGKPLLIPSTGESVRLQLCPGLAAVRRSVHVFTKCLKKAQIEEGSGFVRVGYWIAAKNAGFQNSRKSP